MPVLVPKDQGINYLCPIPCPIHLSPIGKFPEGTINHTIYVTARSCFLQSWRVVHFQSHQVASNVLCSYSRRVFAPPTPAYRFKDVRDLGCLIIKEGQGKELAEYRCLNNVS